MVRALKKARADAAAISVSLIVAALAEREEDLRHSCVSLSWATVIA